MDKQEKRLNRLENNSDNSATDTLIKQLLTRVVRLESEDRTMQDSGVGGSKERNDLAKALEGPLNNIRRIGLRPRGPSS